MSDSFVINGTRVNYRNSWNSGKDPVWIGEIQNTCENEKLTVKYWSGDDFVYLLLKKYDEEDQLICDRGHRFLLEDFTRLYHHRHEIESNLIYCYNMNWFYIVGDTASLSTENETCTLSQSLQMEGEGSYFVPEMDMHDITWMFLMRKVAKEGWNVIENAKHPDIRSRVVAALRKRA